MKLIKAALAFSMILLCCSTAASQDIVEYIHTDALGSPVAVSNASGGVVERTLYEPYGSVIGVASDDAPGFTGHVSDSATGLSYMQQRYMDPQLGAFLSVDPVTAEAGDPRHFNRYAYAYNNPYKFMDPDGRCPICPVIMFFVVAMTHSEPANAPAPGEIIQRSPVGDAFDAIPGGGVAVRGLRTTTNIVEKTIPTASSSRSGPEGKTTRGGENSAAAIGREAHQDLARKVAEKPGWDPGPRERGADGRIHMPDVKTAQGRYMELKPNTPSGRAAGARQAARYEKQLGSRVRVIYYDPNKYKKP